MTCIVSSGALNSTHCVPWRPMPSVCRRHPAPPSDACRQHSCRPVHSRHLYHQRQAVVYAEWTPQLNPDKPEALFVGTATQLRAVSSLTSVTVADVDFLVADSMRILGITRSSPGFRTTRRVSFYKRLDGQTSTRCFRRCTGCLLSSASTTSWPC